MPKKTIFILIGFLLIIFLLGKYSTWQFKKWQETLPRELPTIRPEELPKIPQIIPTSTTPFLFPNSLQPPSQYLSPELSPESCQIYGQCPQSQLPLGERIEEFISPNGKLKIKFPSNWIKIDLSPIKKGFPQELVEKYQLDVFLYALKVVGEGKAANLVTGEMIIPSTMQIKEIIEEEKKHYQTTGWEMEIISWEEKEKEVLYEVVYRKIGASLILHSKEKILFLPTFEQKKKIYWVEILTTQIDWKDFENEANEILNNVQLID